MTIKNSEAHNAYIRKHYSERQQRGQCFRLFESQEGRCAICKKSLPGVIAKEVCIDHDHSTGVIRGLLCGKCNRGLGCFGDSLQILIAAVNYLARFDTTPNDFLNEDNKTAIRSWGR